VSARDLAHPDPHFRDMATSENTKSILEAITRLSSEIRDALTVVNVAVAGLRSDVAHLSEKLQNLSDKVDRIDEVKAARVDLQAVEVRIEKTIAQMKEQQKMDLGRLDTDKIGHAQFSIDSFENLTLRLDEIERRVEKIDHIDSQLRSLLDQAKTTGQKFEEFDRFRWKLIGGYTALVVVGGILGFILKAVLH
jgi:DNA repair exonuclease SbcCD ATPase subunit